MLNKTCTRTAKTAPYPPCTVTTWWLKKRGSARCLRRVTQPPHIAGPLVQMLLRFLNWPRAVNYYVLTWYNTNWSSIWKQPSRSRYRDSFFLTSNILYLDRFRRRPIFLKLDFNKRTCTNVIFRGLYKLTDFAVIKIALNSFQKTVPAQRQKQDCNLLTDSTKPEVTALVLTRTVGVINLSQFLLAT